MMRTNPRTPRWTTCGILWIALGVWSVAGVSVSRADGDALTRRMEAVRVADAEVTDAEVEALLRDAFAVDRAPEAYLACRAWLQGGTGASRGLVPLAAEAATLAADYPAAVTFWKILLEGGRGSETERDHAAGRLYDILVRYMDDREGAYAYMRSHGAGFRVGPRAKRYDLWFLREAREREDAEAVAARLEVILSDGMPLALERGLYWEFLDWLLAEVERRGMAAGVSGDVLLGIAGRIRDDASRSARCRFAGEALRYMHAVGENAERADPARMVAAAEAYLEADPRTAAVRGVYGLYLGGSDHFRDGELFEHHREAKQAVWGGVWERLSREDRIALMHWSHHRRPMVRYLADARQWGGLVAKDRRFFADPDIPRDLPLFVPDDTDEGYRALGRHLEHCPAVDAAVVRAMAAGGDFPNRARRLLTEEAWRIEPGEVRGLLRDRMWETYAGREDGTDEAGYHRALVQDGASMARVPALAWDRALAREYAEALWAESGSAREALPARLEALAWIPWTGHPQRDIHSVLERNLRDWSRWVDRNKDEDNTSVTPKMVEMIPVLRAAIEAFADRAPDPSAAPDPLCAAYARMQLAGRSGDRNAYTAAARAMLDHVKGLDNRTPFARWGLEHLIQGDRDRSRITVQRLVLAEVLTYVDPARRNEYVLRLNGILCQHQWGADWTDSRREEIAGFEPVFREALLHQARNGGRIWMPLYDWWRHTARNHARGAAAETITVLLNGDVLYRSMHADPFADGPRSVARHVMWLLAHGFPDAGAALAGEVNPVDLAVREIRETGYVDRDLWRDAEDTGGAMANAAARVFAGHATLPFGYGDGARSGYDASSYWAVLERILSGAGEREREALLNAVDAAFGETRFDPFAVNVPLWRVALDVRTAETRAAYFGAMAESVRRAGAVPRAARIVHTETVRDVARRRLTTEEEDLLIQVLTDTGDFRGGDGNYREAARVLFANLVEDGRWGEIQRLAPTLFLVASRANDAAFSGELADLATGAMQEGRLSVAIALSGAGLAGGTRAPEAVRERLAAIRTGTEVGTGRIPVPPTDPRYPLFLSQQQFATGRIETAWQGYREYAERMPEMIRDLSPAYTLWVIRQGIATARLEEAERLARGMLTWVSETPDGFTLEDRGTLHLLYGDIAFERGEFPVARARYASLAGDREFEETRVRARAYIRVADVDRVTRQYDEAETRLRRLLRERDRTVRAEAQYLMARIRFDQEDYAGANERLEDLFALAPDHAEGRILEGRIQLGMRRLMEATQVRLGIRAEQRIVVPGQPLRIHLEDRNLAVAGRASMIEVRIWTRHGDEEHVALRPFGESRTAFQGTIDTVLGAARPGDGVMQILGGDEEIFYAFSERFRADHNIEAEVVGPLTVASDARLYISSGEILTEEDRERRRMEEMIRRELRIRDTRDDGDGAPLSERRPGNQIKPGNPIHVRVVDPARSATTAPDEIHVRAFATSGDIIARVPLRETGSTTGVFEGRIVTDRAPAMAFAGDSNTGADPNTVISAPRDAPWVALPDNRRPKVFTVDLNDSVPPGTLRIRADVPGRRLTRFAVQTSVNAREFHTVARYPNPLPAWDGTPVVELVRFDNPSAYDVIGGMSAHERYFALGHDAEGNPRAAMPLSTLAVERTDAFHDAMRNPANLGWHDKALLRARARFYLPAPATRRFRLDYAVHPDRRDEFDRIWLVLNGEEIWPARDGTLAFERPFRPGLHTLEIVMIGTYRALPSFTLLHDDTDDGTFVACPPSLFDPAAQPPDVRAPVPPVTTVERDGEDAFTLTFAPDTQARLVRLVLLDFEGDAPALRELTLTDTDGKRVLPLDTDLSRLRENDILEIVPGDRITVEYIDPRPVSPDRERHEAFMNATYHDAVLSAAYVEHVLDARGERHARYHGLRRFRVGDPVTVFIRDPDMDTTPQPDEVEIEVRTTGGAPVTIRAIETGPHTGVFLATIFPVAEPGNRAVDIHTRPGEEILIRYRDEENLNPGVPYDRTYRIEQAVYATPIPVAYGVRSVPLPEDQRIERKPDGAQRPTGEFVPVLRTLVYGVDENHPPTEPIPAWHGVPVRMEVFAPYLARSGRSRVTFYAQTESARRAAYPPTGADDPGAGDDAGIPDADTAAPPPPDPDGPMDLNVPGTLAFEVGPGVRGSVSAPPGYRSVTTRPHPSIRGQGLDAGQFGLLVPHELGSIPTRSYATLTDEERERIEVPDALTVQGGDTIHVGFRYEDEGGATRWMVRSFRLESDAFLDVMDRRFEEPVEGAYVGETLHVRVIHPSMDRPGARERVTVEFEAESGARREVVLTQAYPHTPTFTGMLRLAHVPEGEADTLDAGDFPVRYGDRVTISYAVPGGETLRRDVRVHRGADGRVVPFTKRFENETMAIRTLFTLAESHFEMAKMHRRAGDESLARRQMGQARRILEEALLQYRDDSIQAQAEYLLGNLSLEFGDIAENEEVKRRMYADALDRFSGIPGRYPESPFAPRAQFKIALTYEKMGDMDVAAEEYVKLSYRYPDNEFVPETMGRLGQHFLRTGRTLEDAAEAMDDPVGAEAARIEARENYVTAAEVFERVRQRFPEHDLAPRTQLLSGQSFIRAERFEDAVAALRLLIDDRETLAEIRAEAMFWAGMAQERLGTPAALRAAYTVYRQVTWDYPESRWARFARGRLADPNVGAAGEE